MAAEATALTRFRDFARRRRFAPFAHTPPEDTPAQRRYWFGLMIAGWLTMAGALIASSALITSTFLLVEMALVMVAAFPVVRRLHFSTMPRFWPNQITFLAALILGIIHWRLGLFTGGGDFRGLVVSYRTLVALFYWVMVFRAFAIRSVGDLTQTALPAVSGLLLVLIAAPGVVAYIGTTLVIGGTLALLAAEHAASRLEAIDARVSPRQVRAGSWRPTVNSWLSLLVAAAVAATIIAALAARYQPSNEFAQELHRQLAWRLARLMIREDQMPWMPTDTLELGGPAPSPEDRVLLTIRSEGPVKPRTAVYDIYQGYRWEQSPREWQRLRGTGGTWVLPPLSHVGTSAAAVDVIDVEITSSYGFIGLLPVPYYPEEIALEVPSVRVDRAGMVSFTAHVMPGDTYTARVAMPAAATTPPGTPHPTPRDMAYALQLPDTLPPRVGRLARRLIAEVEAQVPAMQAIAIENYLRDPKNFTYDLDAPLLPQGRDYVDHFLSTSKRGYCNHFASAMVVMVRTLGIPARLATGFTSGQFLPARGVYEIRDQDAHAWVEVFLPDTGWVDFDPTPDVDAETQSATGAAGIMARLRAWRDAVIAWGAENAALVAALGVLLLVAVIGGTMGARWYGRQLRPLRRGAAPRDRVIHAYRQALRVLQRAGLTRPPSAAPWQFQRAIAGEAPPLAQELAVLTRKYVLARYAAGSPPEGDAAAAEAALLRLRDAVRELDDGAEGAS